MIEYVVPAIIFVLVMAALLGLIIFLSCKCLVDQSVPWIIFSGILVFVIAVAVIAAGFKSEDDWDHYSVDHHCKAVAHTSGTSSYGMMSNGKYGMLYTPGKTTYACDGGETFTR